MTEMTSPLKTDISRILAWSLFLPVLCAWPFLSAMPLFTLWGGGLSVLAFSINAVMLLTGFWPVMALLGASVLLKVEGAGTLRQTRSERGLLLGGYATVWTGLYLIIAFARP
jgi:CHASE2 domain-containing sensor protein